MAGSVARAEHYLLYRLGYFDQPRGSRMLPMLMAARAANVGSSRLVEGGRCGANLDFRLVDRGGRCGAAAA